MHTQNYAFGKSRNPALKREWFVRELCATKHTLITTTNTHGKIVLAEVLATRRSLH